MIERLQELLAKPAGVMFGLLVIMLIFSFTKHLRNSNKRSGYVVAFSPLLENIIIFCMFISSIFVFIFIVLYIFDVRATNGDTLYGHIMLFAIMAYIFFPLYLFYGYKRVFFNKEEIIVKNFMRKTKTYYWEDIIKVVNSDKDKITVTTTNGKFTVDNEFINVKKFLKILEEKNINVENKSLLER